MATAEAQHDAHGHDHDHPEWLAHHFESTEQQFDAGKLGMWLFLAQEVLFFSGLFVAYAIYRAYHPEMFVEVADNFLNPWLGMLNTIVLLASSLAIAWGVRAAQKNQQSTLMWTHVFTLACAGFFLGVKVVEYGFKFDEGLYWAGWGNWSGTENFGLTQGVKHLTDSGFHTHFFSIMIWSLVIGLGMFFYGWSRRGVSPVRGWVLIGLGLTVAGMGGGIVVANGIQESANQAHAAHNDHAAHSDADHHDEHAANADHDHDGHEPATEEPAAPASSEPAPRPASGARAVNAGNFFSIYFAMTGVHALHILAGVIAISWIIARIARGDFGPERYGPVEYVGLYWHLVDLVWIYLFPLLYLIR